MYKEWLYLTCKWATKGLEGEEFYKWQTLTIKLDKECLDCIEGSICESCGNSGLNLNDLEKMIVRNIERSLDLHRTDKLN